MAQTDEIKKAKEILAKHEAVFLALPKEADIDALAAGALLLGRLARLNKRASVAVHEPPAEQWSFLPLNSLSNTGTRARELVITVQTKASPVSEIRYEKSADAISIFVTPKENPVPASAVSVREAFANPAAVITLGIQKLEELGDIYKKNPRLFYENPIIAVSGGRAMHDRHGEANLIYETAVSDTEAAWEFSKELNSLPMLKDEATLILAGIESKSARWLRDEFSPGTLRLIAECVEKGGEQELIHKALRLATPLAQLQLSGRALARSRKLENQGIILAVLTSEDFKKTGASAADIPFAVGEVARGGNTADLAILLWQIANTGEVRAAVAGPRERLAALARALEGSLEFPIFLVSKPFTSFDAAEAELAAAAGAI